MFSNLIQRRVPQILGLYLGGCWIAVEFVSFLTERYLLSDSLTDLTLVVLFAMTPTVAVIAWFHGTPGKDRVVTAEKIFVPLNVLLAAALVGMMFHGKELGATTTTVSAVDDEGQTVSRIVPKQSFRRDLALFFFDNAGAESDLDWLQYGFNTMLMRDLEQDPFMSVWSPFSGYEQSGMLSLQRAGFDDGLQVPLPLMRQIARQRSLPNILTGQFTRSDGGYAVEARLHWTTNERPSVDILVRGRDPMEAVDALTKAVKAELEVPSTAGNIVADLTVAEHFSASVPAIRSFVQAVVATTIHNDTEQAIRHWQTATDEDPSFSAAHLRAAIAAFNAGQTNVAVPAAKAARQHDYKLLHDEKFRLKALDYSIDGQSDKVTSVYATWAELYPEDIDALANLGYSYIYRDNEIDTAIATFERLRSMAPNELWVLTTLANLQSIRGDTEAALTVLNEYSEARPQDYTPWLVAGRLRLAAGDLVAGRDDLAKAVLMSEGRVDPVLELARLNLREGKYEEALERIEDARAIATVPRQESAVLRVQIDYYLDRGMLDELVDSMNALYEVDRTYRSPINLMMTSRMDYIEHYVTAKQTDFVLAELAQLDANFEPPLSELVQVGYLTYYLTIGDLEKSRPLAARVRKMVDDFKRDDMQYLNDFADARIHELSGDLPAAIAAAESSLAKFGDSVQSVEELSDRTVLRNTLGHYRLMAGDLDAAESALKETLALHPAEPTANLRLAQVALARGDNAGARSYVEVALKAWENAREDYALALEARELASHL